MHRALEYSNTKKYIDVWVPNIKWNGICIYTVHIFLYAPNHF